MTVQDALQIMGWLGFFLGMLFGVPLGAVICILKHKRPEPQPDTER